MARVVGELHFAHNIRVNVRERLIYSRLPAVIDWYGYVIWRGSGKLFWYDPQPLPYEPGLQSTHPHHKHVSPDIKHNRVPAPNMSFTQPNLPEIIQEIERMISNIEGKS